MRRQDNSDRGRTAAGRKAKIKRSRSTLMIRAECAEALPRQRRNRHRRKTEIGVPLGKRHDHAVVFGRVRRLIVIAAVAGVSGLLRLMHQGVRLGSHRQHVQHQHQRHAQQRCKAPGERGAMELSEEH